MTQRQLMLRRWAIFYQVTNLLALEALDFL
jgi:hypothetical protein